MTGVQPDPSARRPLMTVAWREQLERDAHRLRRDIEAGARDGRALIAVRHQLGDVLAELALQGSRR